jgi:type I restriction enzyme S subunit
MSAESKVPEIRFEGFSGEWEECSLSKFVSSLDAGVSVNSGEQPAGESEFGILKTSCVTNGIFEPYENKVVFETNEISRLKEPVSKNTIIISRMNTPTLVGANAYINQNFENHFLPDRLWAAKPTLTGDLRFIAYILGSAKGRAALSELATGTSGSMKNISKPSVFELKFQAPVDKEQTKIGNYFQQLDTLIAEHQDKHDKLLQIKKSLLEKCSPNKAKRSLKFVSRALVSRGKSVS